MKIVSESKQSKCNLFMHTKARVVVFIELILCNKNKFFCVSINISNDLYTQGSDETSFDVFVSLLKMKTKKKIGRGSTHLNKFELSRRKMMIKIQSLKKNFWKNYVNFIFIVTFSLMMKVRKKKSFTTHYKALFRLQSFIHNHWRAHIFIHSKTIHFT